MDEHNSYAKNCWRDSRQNSDAQKKNKLLFPGGAAAPPAPWFTALPAGWLAGLLAGWLESNKSLMFFFTPKYKFTRNVDSGAMVLHSAPELTFPENSYSGARPSHTFRLPGLRSPGNQGFLMHQNKNSQAMFILVHRPDRLHQNEKAPIPKWPKVKVWMFPSP